jgi:hypothetical protein
MSPTKIQLNLSLQLSHFRGVSECFEAIADQPEPLPGGALVDWTCFFLFQLGTPEIRVPMFGGFGGVGFTFSVDYFGTDGSCSMDF